MLFRALILSLLTGIAFAADTPVISSYRDFSGGLNTMTASVSLQPNESPNLQNVVIDEPMGALSQRKGYASCGNTPSGNTATNLFEYSKNDGSRNLIVTDNVSIWQTADCVTFSTVVTGLSDQQMPRFAIVQDKLWAVNGSTFPIIWDGTSVSYLDGHNSSTPLGPKGKYIVYWKSRVWIGNTPTSPSGVYFTALVDSNGAILDPATSTAAWSNQLNLIYYERDSGSPIYGMKVYRDNLFVWKENAILRTLFESEYTPNGITVGKTASKTGCKFNESIVEMDDGLIRFVGQDGVYAFDGSMVKRLSTKWTPTFYTIKQPSRAESYKLWDTNTEFLEGSLSSVSTAIVSGSLSLSLGLPTQNLVDNFTDGEYTSSPAWTPLGNNNFSATAGNLIYGTTTFPLTSPQTVEGYLVYPSSYSKIGTTKIDMSASTSWRFLSNIHTNKNTSGRFHFISDSETPAASNGFALQIRCEKTLALSCYSTLLKCTAGSCATLSENIKDITFSILPYAFEMYHTLECKDTTIVVTASSISITGTGTGRFRGDSVGTYADNSLCAFSYTGSGIPTSTTDRNKALIIRGTQITNPSTSGSNAYRITGSSPTFDNLYLPRTDFLTSGLFTSQISTATGLTIWKTFDADQTSNGKTITYEIRTASTVYNMAGTAYRSISPGARVDTSTNTFSQWKASFSTNDNSVSPYLNSASIGWITGDVSKSVVTAVPYKSRYWMSASTITGNQYNDLTMVESKSPLNSYTRYDLPLSAMVIWNNNLYGAIGNTSKIARMDYGDTDDGTAITSIWDSPDDVFGNPIMHKTINRLIVDYSSVPGNNALKIGLSDDLGNTWQYRTINTARYPSLLRDTIVLNMDTNRSLQFRSRIFNNKLGIGFKIYGLHGMGDASMFFSN